MSSRPECSVCNEKLTMGDCSCSGGAWFGPTRIVNGKKVKDERPYTHMNGFHKETGEKMYGWVPTEELHLWRRTGETK